MGSDGDHPAGADRVSRAGLPGAGRVVDRFMLASTSGPVEHVKTWCLNDHGLTQRVDALVAWPMVRTPKPAGASG